ncbi:hypothetical protein IMSHALPRED_008084 [Imshaugia aleurites]|uniref:Uncharacterized protein n=1 Tax=Imshaugia aleurites TaxID=172621 RepID=A0A8H3IWT4_9LECA|nr:hypothetical protein IMSHALPRED_008084 [Imshaugia aleurites]
MLDDLVELSNSYAAENREMRKRGQDISYGESETSRRQELRTGAEDPPYTERFPSQPTYAVPPPQPAYSTGPGPAAYPGSVYPSGSSYQPGPSYPATSGYLTPGHLASIPRPGTNDSSYTYGEEYTNSGPSYRQAPTYPSAGGYRDPREETRAYSRADPRDTRMDPRDPRLDPRDPRLDPRDLRMDPRDPRMDPRDPRLDARADPRTLPSYPYVSSPGDVSMHGAVDDPRGAYDYVSSIPTLQSGRGGSFTPSGVVPRGYDPRDSPQMRDGYRTEPIREERRSRR